MNVQQLGSYIRRQRQGSRLSLSKVSGLAGVSIPYLSQVERGLRKPSADILQAIAKALRISAETLYIEAGILEARAPADVPAAIVADPALTPGQKEALVQIYHAFRAEAGPAEAATPPRPRRTRTASPAVAAPVSTPTPDGSAKTPSVRGPRPGRVRAPTDASRKEV